MKHESSVSRQVLTLQVLVVVVLVAAAGVLAAYDARSDARRETGARALSVAGAVADSPTTREALRQSDPSAILQPYAEAVRRDSEVDFVTIMRLDRTRLTHPDPAQIGQPFIGDLGTAPEGGRLIQQYTGKLGPSMRAVVPVRDGDQVIALVAVGIVVREIDAQVRRSLPSIVVAAMVVFAVGMLGAWLIARRLRRQTHGLGEREITRMYEYYRAVLHAVREGLVLLDSDGVVQLVNDEAIRLLDLPDDVVGREFRSLDLSPALIAAALGDTAETDDIYLAGQHVLVVSSVPAAWQGRGVGTVVTLRDHTELQAATGELDVAHRLTQALRAQNHEAANRLHTVVSLIETGHPEEAVDFATEELQIAQLLTDQVVAGVGDPVIASLLLAKSAQAAEQGATLRVEGRLETGTLPTRDLVTVLGNLLDNAFDAVAPVPQAAVLVTLQQSPDRVSITVADNGPGLDEAHAQDAFRRGWTTKASSAHGERGVGLALVNQVAIRHGGSVRVERGNDGGARFVVQLLVGAGVER